MTLLLQLSLIFFARVLDVSMGTLRMLLIVKGRRLHAAAIGFFEVIIYIVALGWVVNSLDEPLNLFIYALGFAAGNYVGIFLEEKLALGYVCVQVIPSIKSQPIINLLREEGYGVTVIEAIGKNGPKNILNVYSARKNLNKLLFLISELDNAAFTAIMDAKKTVGGYYKQQKAK
ncbi:DUF2179 domain-containing protein [Proteinivorax tanatarense]|uniref:UPF0316 protein PRVXT_001859 n=1 Tax=Proteinivorax tanatarense TaxID=1260629 RepID=A0AAU7VIF4_9FIRM